MPRTFLVTGSNTGIGRVTAEQLAAQGGRVLLACRSRDKTQPVIDAIQAAGGQAEFVALDLADLDSVRACVRGLLDRGQPIDVLINNAGLAGLQGQTKQGFELTFGTNHLGHFLLTTGLLPLLEKGEAPRIVNVSSKAHYNAKGIDFDALRQRTSNVTGLPEYAVSKLANVLFTKELSRRLGGKIRNHSLHPGVVASDAWRQVPWGLRHLIKLVMLSSEDGARTTLHCATSPAVKDDDGLYYDSCKPKTPSRLASDPDLARTLWEKSEAWVAA
jgi:NAD(P)-dependent dehydrogenase (short-subunit alcohol dehydrogenase family)